ncbi:IS3 family transposase [Lampropedia puyangensis]|uniref:IS3 family transposase n=1 Tax=Lampropedia puyangensis TaxID=1330072 RepID=A0A4S8FAW3_9BURK|nr:IS3 family transposase [Lampropedia puyangensis]THU04610.1 IS3 family transposase [Lampropedia puyangensis]
MTKRRARRDFDDAFRLQVATMVVEQGLSQSQVCQDMDLSRSAVSRWVNQLRQEKMGRTGPGKPITPEQLRIRELEKQLRELESDNALLKKASGLLCPANQVMDKLITELAKKAPLTKLCALLGVSRSGLYARRTRQNRANQICADAVRVKATFEASDQTYGSRRISQALQAQGLRIGRHRARTLMQKHSLRARWKRKFVHTTDSHHHLLIAGNVLARQFTPTAPDTAWVCDITYIRTGSGWLYLAAVMDLYARRIVGWAMASSMHAQLVGCALQMAINSRNPKPGLIVHSDRGSQYASAQYSQLLAKHQLIASMSRKGNCWDNAVMERFFLNLKMERTWRKTYANHQEARCDIADYIVNFYNRVRLHSTLGYCSPAMYERKFRQTQQPT